MKIAIDYKPFKGKEIEFEVGFGRDFYGNIEDYTIYLKGVDVTHVLDDKVAEAIILLAEQADEEFSAAARQGVSL